MKQRVKALLRRTGFELRRTNPASSLKDRNPDVTDREWNIYRAASPFTMLSLERVLANIRAVDHVVAHGIRGDIVDCGVWRGGSSIAMLLAIGEQTPRTLWMYDTYAGMPPAAARDRNVFGRRASELLQAGHDRGEPRDSHVIASASLDEVRANLEASNCPLHRVRFVQGRVEETIPKEMPDEIAVLRLDTDWYESTRHELVHLYPRLAAGGILIVDDYGHWQGARDAVDEYFHDVPLFLNRIDYTGRLAVKPVGQP